MKDLWHWVVRVPGCLTHDRHIPGACILSETGTSLPFSPFAVHKPASSETSSEAIHECFMIFTYIMYGAQVIAPLALTFLVLVLAAAVAMWTSASGVVVIWAMLVSIGLMGATTALLQGGLFGLAGLCPPIYVQACSSHTAYRMMQIPAHVHPCCMHYWVRWASHSIATRGTGRPNKYVPSRVYAGLAPFTMLSEWRKH